MFKKQQQSSYFICSLIIQKVLFLSNISECFLPFLFSLNSEVEYSMMEEKELGSGVRKTRAET